MAFLVFFINVFIFFKMNWQFDDREEGPKTDTNEYMLVIFEILRRKKGRENRKFDVE